MELAVGSPIRSISGKSGFFHMTTLVPETATVRPRVRGDGIEGSRLLEEVVAEYADELGDGIIWLLGSDGAGKTTALRHLAAVFQGNSQIVFLDDTDELDRTTVRENFQGLGESTLVVATRQATNGHPQLHLQPWGTDEILEYLLSAHRKECEAVMRRLAEEAADLWDPEIARVMLDELARDQEVPDASSALLSYIRHQLPNTRQLSTAQEYCLESAKGREKSSWRLEKKYSRLPARIKSLLRHKIVQVPLAAEQLASDLQGSRASKALESQLSLALVESVAKMCAGVGKTRLALERVLQEPLRGKNHAMAASILKHVDPTWCPTADKFAPNLAGAYFSDVNWPHINLKRARLELTEFYRANLAGACFDAAIVVEADFVAANLQDTSFEKALAAGASFEGANLRHANLYQISMEGASLRGADLRGCNLGKAKLCQADLVGACLREANLGEADLVGATIANVDLSGSNLRKVDARRVDFRGVNLAEADMNQASLNGANFEFVVWRNAALHRAGLHGAHLTGSCLSDADLREANLRGARLGEIDWEDANLRHANLSRATFHMGSSRSGLVNSPIASEGSRTGFYTDDLEELYFKSPEEVRKANLRGADLRGANIDHVDFYLVDLRDAKLDPPQRWQASRTGAILSE